MGCPLGPKLDRILSFEPVIRILFSDTMIASTTLERQAFRAATRSL
jgi:hypothetical protein